MDSVRLNVLSVETEKRILGNVMIKICGGLGAQRYETGFVPLYCAACTEDNAVSSDSPIIGETYGSKALYIRYLVSHVEN